MSTKNEISRVYLIQEISESFLHFFSEFCESLLDHLLAVNRVLFINIHLPQTSSTTIYTAYRPWIHGSWPKLFGSMKLPLYVSPKMRMKCVSLPNHKKPSCFAASPPSCRMDRIGHSWSTHFVGENHLLGAWQFPV